MNYNITYSFGNDYGTSQRDEELFQEAAKCIEAGKPQDALPLLNDALRINPSAKIYHRLGAVYFMLNNKEKAVEAFESAISHDANFHKSHASLAEINAQNDNMNKAVFHWGTAIRLDPENLIYLEALMFLAQRISVKSDAPELKNAFLTALNNPMTRGTHLYGVSRLWIELLKTDPDFAPLWNALISKDYVSFKSSISQFSFESVDLKLFISGLHVLTIPDVEFERGIGFLRRYLLGAEKLSQKNHNLIFALADYCLEAEYIFNIDDQEQKRLEIFLDNLGPDSNPADFGKIACYMPLSEYINFDLARLPQSLPKFFVDKHILKPRERFNMASKIAQIGSITDETSNAVQTQYEVFPYPRWKSATPVYKSEPLIQPLLNKELNILVAGTGTGREALSLSLTFPKAKILAVDLSRTSLSYGIQKAYELNIKNVDFMHADILNLNELDQKFDLVVSSGVLHHMQNPIKGWRVITDLLKSDGLMRIALYSRMARRHIIDIRHLIVEQGYENNLEGMRCFRKDAKKLLSPEAYARITTVLDYFKTSECRDLLFHVQEHQYDLREIDKMLGELGLSFVKMDANAETRQKVIQEGHDKPYDLTLAQWHDFEMSHPDSFIAMYQFWCMKKQFSQ